ncbi:hypothetical protein KCP71_13570 [Salmonella enterica subsp. enterica]|nr:hypothetical protein KCP71_13570 [Salmonella enterica subsp. enterica]
MKTASRQQLLAIMRVIKQALRCACAYGRHGLSSPEASARLRDGGKGRESIIPNVE